MGQFETFKLAVFVYSSLIKFHQRIAIDTSMSVIVVSLTTWEAHHSARALPSGCGELPRSFMRQHLSQKLSITIPITHWPLWDLNEKLGK